MLNVKVRMKNKTFWVAFIPAVLLLVQVLLALFGIQWQPETLNDRLLDVVNAAFGLLAAMGIVVDPTTAGIADSDRAMTYTKPRTESETADDEEGDEDGI